MVQQLKRKHVGLHVCPFTSKLRWTVNVRRISTARSKQGDNLRACNKILRGKQYPSVIIYENGTRPRDSAIEPLAKTYKKHYLGLSDNVTYFVEQLKPVEADPFHYRVIFRPTTIIPDIELQTK